MQASRNCSPRWTIERLREGRVSNTARPLRASRTQRHSETLVGRDGLLTAMVVFYLFFPGAPLSQIFGIEHSQYGFRNRPRGSRKKSPAQRADGLSMGARFRFFFKRPDAFQLGRFRSGVLGAPFPSLREIVRYRRRRFFLPRSASCREAAFFHWTVRRDVRNSFLMAK